MPGLFCALNLVRKRVGLRSGEASQINGRISETRPTHAIPVSRNTRVHRTTGRRPRKIKISAYLLGKRVEEGDRSMYPQSIYRRIERQWAKLIRSFKIVLDRQPVLIPIPIKAVANRRRYRRHD